MYGKKLFILICICGLMSACARSTPAPVRWGSNAETRRSYLQKKSGYSSKQATPVYSNKKNNKPHSSGSSKYVFVKRGDTAYSIARQNDVPVRKFLKINNLQPPYELISGQKLQLPDARYYTVKKGDTLYSIAKNNNISLSALTSMNTINAPYAIDVGQELALPYIKERPVYNTSKPKVTKAGAPKSYSSKVPSRSSSKFAKPVKGKVISGFGSKDSGLHNDGINIAAKRGTPVKSAENGIVVYASDKIKGLGNIILIKHAGDWVTTYAHLDKSLVQKGQQVQKGTTIGTVGETGSVDSPQLHFEIRKGTKPVNPNKYM